jgi:hypothetical protein
MSGCAAAIRICRPPPLTHGTSVPSPAWIILRSLSAASAIEMPPP